MGFEGWHDALTELPSNLNDCQVILDDYTRIEAVYCKKTGRFINIKNGDPVSIENVHGWKQIPYAPPH